MGTICTKPPIPVPSKECLIDIKNASDNLVTQIPLDYAKEHLRIVAKMKESSPKPYENLLYSDYPDKNGSKVNALAIQYATSEDAKKRMSNEINEQIKPKVDEETKNMQPMASKAVHKAVEKAIEKAVDQAIDEAIKQIKNKNDNTQTQSQTSGVTRKSSVVGDCPLIFGKIAYS